MDSSDEIKDPVKDVGQRSTVIENRVNNQLKLTLRSFLDNSSSKSAKQLDVDPVENSSDLERDKGRINNQSLDDDRRLKMLYGIWALWLLAGQLVIMNAVFIGVGFGILKFQEYALHLYLGGTLLEVFGIVMVVTRYLFKQPSHGEKAARQKSKKSAGMRKEPKLGE